MITLTGHGDRPLDIRPSAIDAVWPRLDSGCVVLLRDGREFAVRETREQVLEAIRKAEQ